MYTYMYVCVYIYTYIEHHSKNISNIQAGGFPAFAPIRHQLMNHFIESPEIVMFEGSEVGRLKNDQPEALTSGDKIIKTDSIRFI